MRIVCDSCDTRYSIDEARVPQRPFKVRCKHCQHTIVVSRPRWHLAFEGQEVGPLTTAELCEGLQAGAIDPRTLAWREGLDGWRKLAEIDELRGLAPRSGGLFDAPSAPAAQSSAPAVTLSSGPVPMVGSRNESSVLFSITNLNDLARGAAAPRRAPGDSGLIDIRSLAPEQSPSPVSLVPGVVLPAPAPLLVAQEPRRRGWLVPAAVGLVAALLVAVGVLLVLVLLQPRSAVAVEPAPAVKPAKPAVKPAKPAVEPARPAVKPAAPSAASAASHPASPARKVAPVRKRARHRRQRRRTVHHARSTTQQPAPVAEPPKPARQEDELDRLIREATGG